LNIEWPFFIFPALKYFHCFLLLNVLKKVFLLRI